jgi:transposase
MKFGVFQNLEELDTDFKGASLESVREMKRITPNLKKLVIQEAASETINALLETLENLESLKIKVDKWEPAKKRYQQLKSLNIDCATSFKLNPEQFLKTFPNLEVLKIDSCNSKVTRSFFITLLSGLKQLKTLEMGWTNIWFWNPIKIDPEEALQCFQEYGSHLDSARIVFSFRNLENSPIFSIEKKPGGSYCINKSCLLSWTSQRV